MVHSQRTTSHSSAATAPKSLGNSLGLWEHAIVTIQGHYSTACPSDVQETERNPAEWSNEADWATTNGANVAYDLSSRSYPYSSSDEALLTVYFAYPPDEPPRAVGSTPVIPPCGATSRRRTTGTTGDVPHSQLQVDYNTLMGNGRWRLGFGERILRGVSCPSRDTDCLALLPIIPTSSLPAAEGGSCRRWRYGRGGGQELCSFGAQPGGTLRSGAVPSRDPKVDVVGECVGLAAGTEWENMGNEALSAMANTNHIFDRLACWRVKSLHGACDHDVDAIVDGELLLLVRGQLAARALRAARGRRSVSKQETRTKIDGIDGGDGHATSERGERRALWRASRPPLGPARRPRAHTLFRWIQGRTGGGSNYEALGSKLEGDIGRNTLVGGLESCVQNDGFDATGSSESGLLEPPPAERHDQTISRAFGHWQYDSTLESHARLTSSVLHYILATLGAWTTGNTRMSASSGCTRLKGDYPTPWNGYVCTGNGGGFVLTLALSKPRRSRRLWAPQRDSVRSVVKGILEDSDCDAIGRPTAALCVPVPALRGIVGSLGTAYWYPHYHRSTCIQECKQAHPDDHRATCTETQCHFADPNPSLNQEVNHQVQPMERNRDSPAVAQAVASSADASGY
ncbi:hypothetical protein BJY52DRAFT_1224522 [Lactarius psammicola]|nr:hypothetical protein BJY52DRAFT_1224522 [Lactarius psammicola]